MATPIGNLALVHQQRTMKSNLLIDDVCPMWAVVGPSDDMIPDDGLCLTMERTLGKGGRPASHSGWHVSLTSGSQGWELRTRAGDRPPSPS